MHLTSRQLPCGHKFCKSCVEELRQKGVDQSCPLCRKPLPPGPEMLFDLGIGMVMKIKGAIDRSRPGVDGRTPWPALSTKQQHEMNQAVAMLREAADQGHAEAQEYCGALYDFGYGVTQDEGLSFLYCEKAAKQGRVVAQANLGCFYRDGRGCKQNHECAVEWSEKAAFQGHSGAQNSLGAAHARGQGVLQNHERAVEFFAQSAVHGQSDAQNNLAVS